MNGTLINVVHFVHSEVYYLTPILSNTNFIVIFVKNIQQVNRLELKQH